MRKTLLAAGGMAALLCISGCASGVGAFGGDDYAVTAATPDSITLKFAKAI